MAISKASRKGGQGREVPGRVRGRVESIEGEPGEGEQLGGFDDEPETPPVARAKPPARVRPTVQASEGFDPSRQDARNERGATHVMLSRAVVDGKVYAPGDRAKLSPEEADHLAKQGAVRAL